VLEFWFLERFRGLTAKEIWAMLNLLTPIEETRAYQSIFAEGEVIGEAKGEAKGKAIGKAIGKASVLKRQLSRRFGALPAWAEGRIEAAPIAQLDGWLDGIFEATSVEALIGPRPD
jgi:predicted transposase YdaD